jgi:hypothetical protein
VRRGRLKAVPRELLRFDDLGRVLFDRLCRELLAHEAGAAEWHGPVLPLPDGLEAPGFGVRLEGPALAVSAWIRPSADGNPDARLRESVLHAFDDWFATPMPSSLVLTNVETARGALDDLTTHVFDGRLLSRLVLSQPQLLLRLPPLLGICDEAALLPEAGRGRSTGNVDAALALARVFIPKRAYTAAVSTVERHGFAVLTGPPEMGKTAIARMIGLAKLADGWEFHECIRPEQLWGRIDADRPQVFVADDAFGSTEYRPDAAERWAVDLDRALRAMDDRHWLLWTSRPAPLKAALRRIHREHGVERFPRPAEVQVDATDLDVEEKALILFRHAKAARLPDAALSTIRTYGWDIVSHEHFTPERIRRFIAGPFLEPAALARLDAAKLDAAIAAEIRVPTAAMAESFRALAPEHRTVLVALLDVPPGPAREWEVAAAVRRHTAAGFAQHPATLLDRLTDHFVRIVETGAVTWVHPSWRDLVIDELAGDASACRGFLHACSLDGVLLALSVGGGPTGARTLPLLADDGDWDALTDRLAELVPGLDEPDVTRLLVTLEEATREAPHPELDALVAFVLHLVARTWSRSGDSVPIGLLARWLELRALTTEKPSALDVSTTWIELLPSASTCTIAEVGELLALADLLCQHAPDDLVRFAFPDRYHALFEAFLDRVEAEAPQGADRVLLAGVLSRLARLVPALAARALETAWRVADAAPASGPDDWYVPRELSPELRAILDAPTPRPRSGERIVTEVLRDL